MEGSSFVLKPYALQPRGFLASHVVKKCRHLKQLTANVLPHFPLTIVAYL